MTPEVADSFSASAAAYVHIPFCSAICPYCDFAVVAGQDELAERYVDAVVTEIRMAEPWRPLEAIYFGGGTPSHVDPVLLARILEALSDRHGIADGAEISLEANPEDFGAERAGLLHRIGFNRVSFGSQSFDQSVLSYLGRRHEPSQIDSAVGSARDGGFENVSLDLIYGSPGESNELWAATVSRALALKPDHLSCYALTVEAGTPLGRAVRDGAVAPDPDIQADRYEHVESAVPFERYEVSNWSLPGQECRYNLTIWAQGEYEAFGNGAHGFRDGRRYRNHRRLEAYLEHVESGALPRAGEDALAGWDLEQDRLFVGLRRVVGVFHGPGTRALLESPAGLRLIEAGVVESQAERLRVTRPLMTDAVHRSVMSLDAPNVMGESHA